MDDVDYSEGGKVVYQLDPKSTAVEHYNPHQKGALSEFSSAFSKMPDQFVGALERP